MSEEWPDDDARFTGPGCRLDKIEGAASGGFTGPVPRRRWAVAFVYGTKIEFQEERYFNAREAEREAARLARETGLTTTVMPIWGRS